MTNPFKIAKYFANKSPAQILKPILSSGTFEALVTDLNTNDQLFNKNEDSLGVKLSTIGGSYSVTTQVIKGVAADKVTLFDSGEFYDSFAVNPFSSGTGFEITNDPFKTDETGKTTDLRERWGENITGLQKENLLKVKRYIVNEILKEAFRQSR